MADNAFGASMASVVISRDTVGSEATTPNTPASARTTDRSAAQSPPRATEIARSNAILPGLWVARGLCHGDSAFDNPLTRPTLSAVRTNTTAPACDTTFDPSPSADSDGYHELHWPTGKVLLNHDDLALDKHHYRR